MAVLFKLQKQNHINSTNLTHYNASKTFKTEMNACSLIKSQDLFCFNIFFKENSAMLQCQTEWMENISRERPHTCEQSVFRVHLCLNFTKRKKNVQRNAVHLLSICAGYK